MKKAILLVLLISMLTCNFVSASAAKSMQEVLDYFNQQDDDDHDTIAQYDEHFNTFTVVLKYKKISSQQYLDASKRMENDSNFSTFYIGIMSQLISAASDACPILIAIGNDNRPFFIHANYTDLLWAFEE